MAHPGHAQLAVCQEAWARTAQDTPTRDDQVSMDRETVDPDALREAVKGFAGTNSGSSPGSSSGTTGSSTETFDDLPADLKKLIAAPAYPGEDRSRTAASVIFKLFRRGWSNDAVHALFEEYPNGIGERYAEGKTDLRKEIERLRKKFDENAGSERDVERLNKLHAVLPIGGKTRVVTFGELEDFPGRETIVMTQTIADFKSLQRQVSPHLSGRERRTEKHPLGTYWIGSPKRRQYDGGMAFMPQHDGDVGNQLNLWRGFGVKAIKPDGTSGAAGCQKFLDFMRNIICSGNEAHFDYLLKARSDHPAEAHPQRDSARPADERRGLRQGLLRSDDGAAARQPRHAGHQSEAHHRKLQSAPGNAVAIDGR